jgi:hypothetical protein
LDSKHPRAQAFQRSMLTLQRNNSNLDSHKPKLRYLASNKHRHLFLVNLLSQHFQQVKFRLPLLSPKFQISLLQCRHKTNLKLNYCSRQVLIAINKNGCSRNKKFTMTC